MSKIKFDNAEISNKKRIQILSPIIEVLSFRKPVRNVSRFLS